jgi:imidazolonepropionase-like amidohydrolase
MRRLLGVFVLGSLIACSREPPTALLLRDVQIVDLERGEVHAGQSIRIDDGKISSIGPVAEFEGPAARVVEGAGRYVLPGLIDAHVHIDHPDELTLYPAYGVTSALVLRGVPHHLRWRSEIRSGERFGPGLFLTGDYLDGYPAWMEPMVALDGIDPARAAVRRQVEAGYDFIKVFTRLTPEQLTAITEEASALDTCVVGHGSGNYGLEHLTASGQANLAHGQDIIRWWLTGHDDDEGIQRAVAQLAASNTTVTPNLAFTDAMIRQGQDLEAILATDEAKRLHPAILQPFRRANNRYVRNADEWVPSVQERFEIEKRIARMLQEAGVTLLAGTDASTAAVFPGHSLPTEVELLVEAGLTPAEALRAATINPGQFFERCLGPETLVGRLAPGYEADLLLLEDNPLEDVTALRDLYGVMLDGLWFPREELDSKLQGLEEGYAALGDEVIALERALFSGDADSARAIFDRVRAERPDEFVFSQYTPFFVGYGFLYGEDGFSSDPERLATALGLYKMYAETYPDYHSAHYMLALARRANGDVEGARASLERALAIHPEYVKAREQLAELTTDVPETDASE